MPTQSVSEAKERGVDLRWYPFDISVNNPKLVEIGRARHDLGELKVIEDREAGIREEKESGLTNRKRFTSGLDLVYSTTFPFCIHSETIRKHRGSAEKETPNRGKMLG